MNVEKSCLKTAKT